MSAKISIHKVSAQGEQISIEMSLEKSHYEAIVRDVSLRQILEPYFRLVDDRLLEMNSRIIRANHMVKKLSPEAQMAVHNVQEILSGAIAGPPPTEVIQQEQESVEQTRLEAEARMAAKQMEEITDVNT